MKVYIPPKGIYFSYPTLVAVITSHFNGRSNVMSAAWHTALSFEPMLYGIAIAPIRFTHRFIERSGEFTVNFLPFDKAHLITLVGRTSGKEVDKFSEFKLETISPVKVKAPILMDAYAAYECKVILKVKTGDHTFFVGEVLASHEKEGSFLKNGLPNLSVCDPALYIGRNRYFSVKDAKVKKIDPEEAKIILLGED